MSTPQQNVYPPQYNPQQQQQQVPNPQQQQGQGEAQYVRVEGTHPFGPYSASVVCPICHQNVHTYTRPVAGLLTWLGCIFLTGMLCCCLPFCVEGCHDIEHYCPNCRSYLGTYKRI